MTDHDYNRRIATAIGLHDHEGISTGRANPPPDYRTDWSQLPAILAALNERGEIGFWQAEPSGVLAALKFHETVDLNETFSECDGDVDAEGDTLLLAAGALLLRLKEQP